MHMAQFSFLFQLSSKKRSPYEHMQISHNQKNKYHPLFRCNFAQFDHLQMFIEQKSPAYSEKKILHIINYKNLPMEQRDNRGKRASKRESISIKVEENIEVLKLIDDLKKRCSLAKDDFLKIISAASSVLKNEPTMLKISSPIVIVGDIHGQFYDLLKIFEKEGPTFNNKYLFLGDYVDRGKFCIEVITLLFKLKSLYPNNIFLLRGNHEGRTMTSFFNFKLECQKKYSSEVYQIVLDLFKQLPLCALIDSKYFAVHGGISPKLNHLSEIQRLDRFAQINENQPMSDLLWSDPTDVHSDTFISNKMRCCSYYYSPVQSESFLKSNKLNLIIRGHEVTTKGFKYQVSPNNTPLTLTVFSAPNYCDTYHNQAIVASLRNNQIELKPFKKSPHPIVLENYMSIMEFTLPMFSANITQIFKHMLKCSHKFQKRRNSIQKKEDIETIRCIENIQNHFSQHSNQLLDFLLGHTEKKDDPLEEVKDGDFSEDNLMKFLAMKAADEAEKLPRIFGPRKIQFKKVNIGVRGMTESELQE